MNKFLLPIQKRMTSVRELALVGMIALVAMLSIKTTLEAAPVIFAFEAEITEINRSPDATFDLPSNAMVGDILNGLLQFEPFGFGESGEAASLEVILGTDVFSVEDATLATQDNVIFAVGMTVVSRNESIRVGCLDFGSCAALLSSSSNKLELARLGLELSGQVPMPEIEGSIVPTMVDLISQGESLENAELWNRLLGRRLFMEFTSDTGPGSIRLEAAIGSMGVIPEPSSLTIIIIGLSMMTRPFLRRP